MPYIKILSDLVRKIFKFLKCDLWALQQHLWVVNQIHVDALYTNSKIRLHVPYLLTPLTIPKSCKHVIA